MRKKNVRKKNLLSWAVSISVFEYLCAFVFYFCALIIINGLLYKKDVVSVYRSLTLFQGKKKKCYILQNRNRRLSCLWLWWHFCTFKKNYFIYFFPSSDSEMKTRVSHYVLSIIWYEVFVCEPFGRPESNVHNWNLPHMQLCSVVLQSLQVLFDSTKA